MAFGFLFSCSVFHVFTLEGDQDSPLRKAKNGLYVVAHRGAHIGIPENSLPAYQKAIDLGCDFIEIDVRTTKDGKFVSMHNPTVDEYVTGLSGNVSELSLVEIRALDIGSRISQGWKNTKVPTFEEILQLCHGKIGIYLDLKAANVSELIEIIKKYGMERDIFWYIPATRSKEITELITNCPDCILMPDPGHKKNINSVTSRFNVLVLATDMGELCKSFVDSAHRNHSIVIVDEEKGTEAEWTQIIDWDTDGIQTDDPERLISFLKRHGQR
jgi:glycerophosphoryl diester phosphodiesterase